MRGLGRAQCGAGCRWPDAVGSAAGGGGPDRYRRLGAALPEPDRCVAALAAAVGSAVPRDAHRRRPATSTCTRRRRRCTWVAMSTPERLRAAAQALTERYTNLRTAFITDSSGAAVQLVLDRVDVPWRELDLTGSARGRAGRAGACGAGRRSGRRVRHDPSAADPVHPDPHRARRLAAGCDRAPCSARRLVDAAADAGPAGALRGQR